MSAVERLRAAIEKLEALKVESTPGPWYGPTNILGVTRVVSFADQIVAEVFEADVHGIGDAVENAELIVTLHSTIDAQLAILRTSLTLDGLVPMDQALALADSILGGA